jgi:hypothetical protein
MHTGINTLSEHFESNVVTVIVEWNVEESSARYYDILITPPATFIYKQSTIIQLKIPYNIAYTVSVVSTSMVCRRNVTTLTEIYYSKYYIIYNKLKGAIIMNCCF